ncbi:MAG: sigma-70 family RNA polymerase sigma factor [Gemmataceae bacterium]
MSDTRQHPILSYLHRLLGTTADAGVSDAELLRRFVSQRDEAAFELLLWRHAAMVLHVCRRLLRDTDAVEDAFQATFLVFVRKAGSISRRESLGGWLYRVAYRIALKSREQAAKREAVEHGDSDIDRPDTSTEDAAEREVRRIVCEEVDRLPARYRTAIVACFFEGKTHEEAACQLGWPRGTVASRLARGRELLRRRLVRRGIALTAAALASSLAAPTSPAALTGLIRTTIQTVKLFAAGSSAGAAVPPSIAALTEGVLQAMYWTRMKIVMAVLLFAGLGGVGTTFWAVSPSAAEPAGEPTPRPGAAAAPADDKAAKPEDADKLTRDMARSRLNLRKLALAMHAYAEKYGTLPPSAIYDKKGKALLSWRVALLPYLDQQNLYKLFHLDEPWDGEHNKSVLEGIVPKVYAPVGKPDTPRTRTYYQVFVSPARGSANLPANVTGTLLVPERKIEKMDALPVISGSMLLPGGIEAAFVKQWKMRISAGFPDGTVNTLLIVEAGNPVPWTKPEDLKYARDEPLPELGGLFADVFQAAFADGSVRILTKKYDETTLRYAIERNDGHPMNFDKIKGQPRRPTPKPKSMGATYAEWQRKNDELRRQLRRERQEIRQYKQELEVLREQDQKHKPPSDPRLEQLRKENLQLQEELNKARAEATALYKEIARRQKPAQKQRP